MKCGHSEKDTNSAFCKTATRTKKETLKKKPKRKQNNKIKFITEYGPSLPNIYSIWRITNKLKNNEELKNMFKNSVKQCIEMEVKISKGGQLAQILIPKTQVILSHYCYDCGRTGSILNTRKKRVNTFILVTLRDDIKLGKM